MLGLWNEEDQKSYVSMFDAAMITQFSFSLSTLEISSEKISNFHQIFLLRPADIFVVIWKKNPRIRRLSNIIRDVW